VTLRSGTGSCTARVLRLTGSALSSAAGIAIQGARVDASGHFAPGAADRITGSTGRYIVAVPSGSAALITLP
jgi:hypothetical protein